MKAAFPIVLVVGALVLLGLKYQQMNALEVQHHAMLQRLEDLAQLEAENQRIYRLTTELRSDNSGGAAEELARLRAEAANLRERRQEWERLCSENRQLRAELGDAVQPAVPKENWAYIGYNDPVAACQSHLWASLSGQSSAYLDSLCPESRSTWMRGSEEEIESMLVRAETALRKSSSFQIVGQKPISDGVVELLVNLYPDRPDIENLRLTFKRVGAEWKLDEGGR
jgi:hypothetical protein